MSRWKRIATTIETAHMLSKPETSIRGCLAAGRLATGGALSQGHLFGNPEANTSTHQTQPDHQVGLLGAVKIRHGISEKARMDEEAGDSCDGMVIC